MADETPFRNTSGQSYIQNYDFTPHAYIRTMPIQTPLQQAIAAAVYAADPNVQIRVSSGGQTSSRSPSLRNKPGGWTGSDRHNDGGAADFSLVRDGKKLPIVGNEGLYQAVARNLAAQGVPGIGVDTRSGFIHAGGGSEAAWGYEGKSNGARYLPASFAAAINEGRQLHRTQGGIPMPPSEIPNVVASRTDTVPPRVPPVPAIMPPMVAAKRNLQPVTTDVASLYKGILPQRDLTQGGEVDRSVQAAQNAQVPDLAAALQARVNPQTRDVPLPRLDPRQPNRMDLAAPPLPETRDVPLPRLNPREANRMDLAAPELPHVRLPPIPPADPLRAYNQARYASAPAVPPPVVPRDPMAEFNRLRGNPDIVTPSLAARLRPPVVYQPTLGYVKDQSRLMPNPIPIAPQVVRAMPPLPRPRPNNRPMRIAPMPAPLSQRPPPPLRIAVNGAGSYNAPTQQAPWAPQGYTNDGSGRITSNETGGVYYERHLR